MKSKNKKIIYNEIENQIKKFKKLYKLKSIQIDGHEHIQMIPWIFNFIKKLKKKNTTLLKLEFLMKNYYFKIYDLFNLSYFRNLLACILFEIFNYFLDISGIGTKIFIGIIYTGQQSEDTIRIKTISPYKKLDNKSIEVLVHPGFTNEKKSNYLNLNSINFTVIIIEKREYKLSFSDNIKNIFKSFNDN